jgi:hypothetical protein
LTKTITLYDDDDYDYDGDDDDSDDSNDIKPVGKSGTTHPTTQCHISGEMGFSHTDAKTPIYPLAGVWDCGSEEYWYGSENK